MSDYSQQHLSSTQVSVSSKLNICLFSGQSRFTNLIVELLNDDRYQLECFARSDSLMDFVAQNQEHIDCIVFVNESQTNAIWKTLWKSKLLLPTLIIETQSPPESLILPGENSKTSFIELNFTDILYHQAEIRLYPIQLKELKSYIELAIAKFLNLVPHKATEPSDSTPNQVNITKEVNDLISNSLVSQQRRLTEKIKERLGYLGVYYKRNAKDFYRNLSSQEQTNLSQKLASSYRNILLNYFESGSKINQLIDEFVDRAFFADISTSQILEIHMDLIDEFSQQLKIEGRNDDILLDYRLPLIDIIAHLCEIYRRSIPGDDISLELLFRVE